MKLRTANGSFNLARFRGLRTDGCNLVGLPAFTADHDEILATFATPEAAARALDEIHHHWAVGRPAFTIGASDAA